MKKKSSILETKEQLQPGIVLACSGGSDLGELADRVARKIKSNGTYHMKCLAMVAAHDQSLIKTLQTSDTLVIDGCGVDCGKKILEEAWLSDYRYVRLTDLGYKKGQTPVTEELVDKIYNQIIDSDIGDNIVHNKPVDNTCCNKATSDN